MKTLTTYDPDMTLNEVLTALGLTTKPAHWHKPYAKAITDSETKTTFLGDAGEVWRWLRETGRIEGNRS